MDDVTEEEIAERLRRLRPTPPAWVRAACELPRARELLKRYQPRAVLSIGGYAAGRAS